MSMMEIYDVMSTYDPCGSSVHRKKVLIVDDDEYHKKIVSYHLHSFNVEVYCASDGLEAISLAKKVPDLDLILMDIRMPYLNGIAASIEIKKNNPKIPIIIDTALSIEVERENIKRCGCEYYIEKPHSKAQLFSLIRKYII